MVGVEVEVGADWEPVVITASGEGGAAAEPFPPPPLQLPPLLLPPLLPPLLAPPSPPSWPSWSAPSDRLLVLRPRVPPAAPGGGAGCGVALDVVVAVALLTLLVRVVLRERTARGRGRAGPPPAPVVPGGGGCGSGSPPAPAVGAAPDEDGGTEWCGGSNRPCGAGPLPPLAPSRLLPPRLLLLLPRLRTQGPQNAPNAP